MSIQRLLPSLCLILTMVLAACAPQTDESGKRKSRAGEGREETKNIRNTENIGYAGNAIGSKVDQALDITERQPAELERQIETQIEQGNSPTSTE